MFRCNILRSKYILEDHVNMTKLNEDDIKIIKKLRLNGMSVLDISKLYDVTSVTIYRALEKCNINLRDNLENDCYFWIGFLSNCPNLTENFFKKDTFEAWYLNKTDNIFKERLSKNVVNLVKDIKENVLDLDLKESEEFYLGYIFCNILFNEKKKFEKIPIINNILLDKFIRVSDVNLHYYDRGYNRIEFTDFSKDKIIYRIFYGEWKEDVNIIGIFHELRRKLK